MWLVELTCGHWKTCMVIRNRLLQWKPCVTELSGIRPHDSMHSHLSLIRGRNGAWSTALVHEYSAQLNSFHLPILQLIKADI